MIDAVVASFLAFGVAAGSTSFSRPPVAPTPAEAPVDPVDVKKVMDQGKERTDAKDYAAAIEKYEEALALNARVTDSGERANYEPSVVIELVNAHLSAYIDDRDPDHVSAAEDHLRRFSAKTFEVDAEVEERIAALNGRVEELRAEVEARTTSRRTSRDSERGLPEKSQRPSSLKKKQRLVISGAVVTGVGGGLAVGFVATSAALVHTLKIIKVRDDVASKSEVDKPTRGAATALGVLAGVALVTGVALLVVGKKRAPSRRWVYSPSLIRGGAGLGLGGRF